MTSAELGGLRAITFDFGNTLVPVDRAGLRLVVDDTARAAVEHLGPFALDDFLVAWGDERARQFREEVPLFREVDLGDRFVRVLARLRGMAPPGRDGRWDQAAAARLSRAAEIDWAIETYSRAFVRAIPPPPAVEPLLELLASRYSVAILSNWPLAATIDRYVEEAGWAPHLRAVVISQRIGTIKPHPRIFAACRRLLGDPEPATILHVGDDWAADVVGAIAAGWRAAYVLRRPLDSPLPSSEREGSVTPDLEIDGVDELAVLLVDRHGVRAR